LHTGLARIGVTISTTLGLKVSARSTPYKSCIDNLHRYVCCLTQWYLNCRREQYGLSQVMRLEHAQTTLPTAG
jgi:hypothetical protein